MAYGFDPSMLLQAQGVQVPDPVKQYATALSLGDLARRGEAQDLQLRAARKAQDAQDAYDAAAPELVRRNFSTDAVVDMVTANPRAAGIILKESDARRKAALDQEKTGAETDKVKAETRKLDLAVVGGMAQSILSNERAGPRDLQTLASQMQRMGIDPRAFGDPSQDPQAWLRGVAGSSIDAAKQIELAQAAGRDAETARHNRTEETLTGNRDANTAAYQQGQLGVARGNLGVAQAREARESAQAKQADMSQPFEVTVNGKPSLVQQDKRTGLLYDVNTGKSVNGGVAPKSTDLPGSIVEKLAQNNVTLTQIDRAMQMVDQHPQAFGMANLAGDAVRQRDIPLIGDPEGVDARAIVANIAGQKIHDRSGAAVTIGEMERLKPYIPNVTDNAETVKKKLTLFRQEYAQVQQELAQGRSLASMIVGGRGSSPSSATGSWGGGPLQPADPGSGVDFVYTPKGSR
jgi:hypothetical protein